MDLNCENTLLTINEVSLLTGVKSVTIHAWIQRGKLNATKTLIDGRHKYLVDIDEVIDILPYSNCEIHDKSEIEDYIGMRNEYFKKYREANKEKIKVYIEAYREAHKEEIKAYNRVHGKAYREAHKEEMSERNKAYYETNKEEISERRKAYREAHKEEISERKKAYYEANKEEISERRRERRMQKKLEKAKLD